VPRHPDGEQGVADQILDRLFRLAGQAQQRPVVARREQHEGPELAKLS
jgi:hypothetical protein